MNVYYNFLTFIASMVLMWSQQQMKNQRVPRSVYWHMIKYYSCLWTYNKGVTTKSLFVDLPDPMRAEIAVAVTKPMWSKVGGRSLSSM